MIASTRWCWRTPCGRMRSCFAGWRSYQPTHPAERRSHPCATCQTRRHHPERHLQARGRRLHRQIPHHAAPDRRGTAPPGRGAAGACAHVSAAAPTIASPAAAQAAAFGHTLQRTVLVHEAFWKLDRASSGGGEQRDRGHSWQSPRPQSGPAAITRGGNDLTGGIRRAPRTTAGSTLRQPAGSLSATRRKRARHGNRPHQRRSPLDQLSCPPR
jgi:hypothetical protein